MRSHVRRRVPDDGLDSRQRYPGIDRDTAERVPERMHRIQHDRPLALQLRIYNFRLDTGCLKQFGYIRRDPARIAAVAFGNLGQDIDRIVMLFLAQGIIQAGSYGDSYWNRSFTGSLDRYIGNGSIIEVDIAPLQESGIFTTTALMSLLRILM